MQVTSTQLNMNTKRDNSSELSRFFVLFIVLLFVTSRTTNNEFNSYSYPIEIKAGDSALETEFKISSSDYFITGYYSAYRSELIRVRLGK
jgi:hypothetical protein